MRSGAPDPRARLPLSGLSTERTALAWSRTALGAVALGALFAHAGATSPGAHAVAGWIAAGVAVVLGTAAWAYGRTLYDRSRARVVAGVPVMKPGELRWVRGGVVTLALAALVVALA